MTFFAFLLFGIATSQNNCKWNFTTSSNRLFTLDLSNYTDRIYHQNDINARFSYSICNNSLECTQSGTTVYDMVSAYPDGIIECWHMASWDQGKTSPRYDFGSASWRFNYTNGQKCGNTNHNYEVMIFFDCHPGMSSPFFAKAWQWNECGFGMQFQYAGACEPVTPDNEACKFTAFPNTSIALDLSTLKGKDISYRFPDGSSWHYTPCSNGLTCTFPSGNNIATMSQIEDSANDCAKFLGLWSGDVEPRYFKNNRGLDTWAFSWFDGMECGENEPPEEFEVFYVCDPTVDTYKVNGTYVGRCHFTMEIITKLACVS